MKSKARVRRVIDILREKMPGKWTYRANAWEHESGAIAWWVSAWWADEEAIPSSQLYIYYSDGRAPEHVL